MSSKRVLLISSSGGHWAQMKRVESIFSSYEKYYACTDSAYKKSVVANKFYFIPDGSKSTKIRLIIQAVNILFLLIIIKPDVVLSTGAAPGFFALFFAKKLGIKTIWIDSKANIDKLSLSGQLVEKYADLWLTQWEHLARPEGPHYYGSVM